MDDELRRYARSYGSVADVYDRGRPSFPREAAEWLVGSHPVTVLELGAGTGKLTEHLVALGHDVHATDPAPEMLDELKRRLPDTRATAAGAEDLPVPDRSIDVVVAAQCFHWFDHDRALPEIARVLKPGGQLALVWNRRDERIPWVRRLGRIVGNQDQLVDESAQPLVLSSLFGFVEEATFPHWQEINRETVLDLALSLSTVASLDEDARAAKLDEVRAFYAEFGRGMDGMQLPYDACCFKAVVTDRPETGADDDEETSSDEPNQDGPDDDMLLIDFR